MRTSHVRSKKHGINFFATQLVYRHTCACERILNGVNKALLNRLVEREAENSVLAGREGKLYRSYILQEGSLVRTRGREEGREDRKGDGSSVGVCHSVVVNDFFFSISHFRPCWPFYIVFARAGCRFRGSFLIRHF